MTLTKEQIDELVEGLPFGMNGRSDVRFDEVGSHACWFNVPRVLVARTLYLAAGLTAEGQRKPERVRCLAYIRVSGAITIAVEDPKLIPTFGDDILEIRGGYFVPDGAA